MRMVQFVGRQAVVAGGESWSITAVNEEVCIVDQEQTGRDLRCRQSK